jgi:Protein of unknown function (DUF3102)
MTKKSKLRTLPVSSQVEVTTFDYSSLDQELANSLRTTARQIRAQVTGLITGIIKTGRMLLDAKAKLEHGQFTDWVENEIGCSVRTAENYMRAATLANECKDETISHLPPTTIYRLAAPRLPAGIKSNILFALEAKRDTDLEEINEQLRTAKATTSKTDVAKNKTPTNDVIDIVAILRDELADASYHRVCALMLGLEPPDFQTLAKVMSAHSRARKS